MKKISTLIGLALLSLLGLAQSELAPNFNTFKQGINNAQKTSMANCSSWFVEMDYPAATITGAGSLAGVTLVDSVFWVTQWNSGNMYVIDTAGNYITQFTVSGVTGARSLTYDGQYVYAGAATNNIYKIDPATQTLMATIPTPVAARHCTYDSSANSGAGGFWVGNWNTDIVLVDTAGTQLSSIAAATHGMTAMYGSTVDHMTPGGPFLWVFDQSQAASSAVLVQIDLTAGTPTGVVHDAAADVGFGQANPLAGGMFVANTLKGGQPLICGLLQGNGNIFGYRLDTTAFIDLSLERALLTEGYGHIPDRNLTGVATDITVDFNNRSCTDSTLDAYLIVEVEYLSSIVYTDSVTLNNIPSPTTASYDFTGYQASGIGEYNVLAYLSHDEATDINRANDTIRFSFQITDSTYSRDNDFFASGSLGLPDGDEGLLGQVYNMAVDQALYSVDVFLRSPTDGDSIKIEVYDFVPGGDPTTLVYQSPAHIIQGDTAQWIRIETELNLFEASYFVGVRQFADNISLGTSEAFFVPGVAYYMFEASQAWTLVENGGFSISYFLRPNVGDLIDADTIDAIGGADLSNVSIFPNPANESVVVRGLENAQSLNIYNNQGQAILSKNNIVSRSLNLDVSELASGMYQVVITGSEGVETRKLSIK